MLGKLVIFMKQDISSTEVPMSFPNTLVIHGYGIVYGLVVVLMEAFVTLTLIQVPCLSVLFSSLQLQFKIVLHRNVESVVLGAN